MNLAGVPPYKQHLSLIKPYLERQLELTGVKVHLGRKVTAEDVVKMNADTVVLAIGDKPDASLYEELKDKVPEIYNIGDSNGGGIIPNAVYEGYTTGNKL